MFYKPALEKSGGCKSKAAVVFWVTLFIAFVGPGLFALDGSQALAKKKGKKICNQTAGAAFKACQNEIKDDYWIAVGNCKNLSDRDERSECLQDAKADLKDARQECRDQKEARLEVCQDLGQGAYDPQVNDYEWLTPAQIAADPNPYFPLVPGNRWVYQTTVDGEITETIAVEVLHETVTIEGVECVVVHDTVYEGDLDPDNPGDAVVIEDTYDWYAQDTEGNVWYFGERSLGREGCEDGEEDCAYLLSNEGSWRTGLDGAKQGIIMFANPSAEVGTVYRQEFALGDAEDLAQVISTDAQAPVDVRPLTYPCTEDGAGVCLQTRDFTPIEPGAFADKYYKAGIGVVLEDEITDEGVRELVELVEINFTP